jgi:hypothetical protein
MATLAEEKSIPRPLSVLEYHKGWISAIGITQNLVAVPGNLKVELWVAYGGYIALGIDVNKVIIVDCRHLLNTAE